MKVAVPGGVGAFALAHHAPAATAGTGIPAGRAGAAAAWWTARSGY